MEVVQELVKGGIVATSMLLCDSSQVNHLLPCRVAVLGLGLEERRGGRGGGRRGGRGGMGRSVDGVSEVGKCRGESVTKDPSSPVSYQHNTLWLETGAYIDTLASPH